MSLARDPSKLFHIERAIASTAQVGFALCFFTACSPSGPGAIESTEGNGSAHSSLVSIPPNLRDAVHKHYANLLAIEADGDKLEAKRASFAEYDRIVNLAVQQGFWISGKVSGEPTIVPIVRSILFTQDPIDGLQHSGKGVFKVFDPELYPEVNRPIKIHVINSPELKHLRGEASSIFGMINLAAFDVGTNSSRLPVEALKVLHDEVSSALLILSGKITSVTMLDPVPERIKLGKKLGFKNLGEFSEFVSCACCMDIDPVAEIGRLISFEFHEKISGTIPSDYAYKSAAVLMLHLLQAEPGAENFSETFEILTKGVTTGTDAHEVSMKRMEATTRLTELAKDFNPWLHSRARRVADNFVAATKEALNQLCAH